MASKAIGLLTMVFGADMKGFDKAMKKADRSLGKFSKKMKAAGRSMTQNLTLPILAIGTASAKLSMDFEAAMTKITTLVGISEKEVAKMKDGVLALSGETSRSPQELAEALFFLTSAGLRGANAMETLEQVAKGTAAGLGEMEALSRTVAAAQNAYGVETMTAAKALDVFGGMVQTGMFKSEELAQVLGQNLGLAANLGIQFEEVGAFIATYTKTTGDANSATTGLSAVMMSFAKITPIQEKALAKINMSAQDVRDSLGTHGLQTTLISLADKFKKSGVDLSKFFTKSNALKGVLGVLGNQTETYVEILEDLEQKQGFVDSAFDRTSKTAGFQLNQAFASLKTAGIELGDTLAPMIKSIANSVVELARTYRGLTTGQKETITTTLKWVAALGPATMLIGSMANGIRVLIPLFIKIGKIVAANPIAAMATVAAFAIFKLTKALFENATVTERIAKKSAQIDLRVKQAANEATSEQIRLINKQLLIARDAEASDVDRASAIKFLNKEVRSLNGQLSLENIHTQNTTDSIKKHTQAVIENAKAQALKDELAEASRELSKIEEQWNTNMAAKLKTAAAAKDKSVMDSEVISWATTQMKSQTKERDALRKLVNSIAKKITKAEIKAAPLTKAKTFDEIQVTKYANSINGLNQKLADLNVLYQDLEPTSKDYNKVASEITSTQGMLNKKYQKTTGSVGELTGVTSDLNGVLSEEKQKLNDLIEAGASQEELEAQATKVKEAIDKVNKNLQKYNELVPDKTEASEGFSALKDAVADAEIALQTAIASGGDYAVQLQDFITATDKLKKAQDEYNDAVGDTTEDKIPAWIKLIDMFQPKLKIFGKSLSEIFEESGEAIADALDTALNAFDAYQNRMTTVANNEKKRDEKNLDEKLRNETARINNSTMTEEQRVRALALLDDQVAQERVAIEEKTEAKLMAIKKRQALADKAIAIASIIQNTAAAIMKAFSQVGIFGGPLAAGVIGALGAAQIALVASTPIPLADGGIISGPTTALMGEYPSAGSGNPEVVAPLNKLKSMMGGGGTKNIRIYGRLTGNDIYLSNQSESINRLRTT